MRLLSRLLLVSHSCPSSCCILCGLALHAPPAVPCTEHHVALERWTGRTTPGRVVRAMGARCLESGASSHKGLREEPEGERLSARSAQGHHWARRGLSWAGRSKRESCNHLNGAGVDARPQRQQWDSDDEPDQHVLLSSRAGCLPGIQDDPPWSLFTSDLMRPGAGAHDTDPLPLPATTPPLAAGPERKFELERDTWESKSSHRGALG
jgi:hypothetical protein